MLRRFAELGGAGNALTKGAGTTDAIVAGLAAGHWSEAVNDANAEAWSRREMPSRTNGLWRRLWVRIVG